MKRKLSTIMLLTVAFLPFQEGIAGSDEEWLYVLGTSTTVYLVAVGGLTEDEGEEAFNDFSNSFFYELSDDELIKEITEKNPNKSNSPLVKQDSKK